MPGKSSCCGYCSGNNIVLATRSTIFDDHLYLISQTTAEHDPILQKVHHGAPRSCDVIVHGIFPSPSSDQDRHWSREPGGSPEDGADQAFCFTGGGRSGSPDPGCEKNWDGLTTLKSKFSQIEIATINAASQNVELTPILLKKNKKALHIIFFFTFMPNKFTICSSISTADATSPLCFFQVQHLMRINMRIPWSRGRIVLNILYISVAHLSWPAMDQRLPTWSWQVG